MNAEIFVDTNIFLYAIDDSDEASAKRDRARHVLRNDAWGWSTQVAAEFFTNATSPKRPFRLSAADATSYVETWLVFPTAAISTSTVRRAMQMHQRFQISYWDAAIISAAKELGCAAIYSEDLNDGQDYDGVRVIDPFASRPQS